MLTGKDCKDQNPLFISYDAKIDGGSISYAEIYTTKRTNLNNQA